MKKKTVFRSRAGSALFSHFDISLSGSNYNLKPLNYKIAKQATAFALSLVVLLTAGFTSCEFSHNTENDKTADIESVSLTDINFSKTEDASPSMSDDKLSAKAADFLNLNNYFYNYKTPCLFITPPSKKGSEARANNKAVETLLKREHADTLDLSDIFDSSDVQQYYHGTNITTYEASRLLLGRISLMLFDEYVLMRGYTDKKLADSIVENSVMLKNEMGENFNFMNLHFRKGYNFKVEKKISESSTASGLFDEVIISTDKTNENNLSNLFFCGDAALIHVSNPNGIGNITVIHNGNDYSTLSLMALYFADMYIININLLKESVLNTVKSYINASKTDLCISIIDVNSEYPAFSDITYVMNDYKDNGNASTIRDYDKVLQVRYDYIDPSIYLPNVKKLSDLCEKKGIKFSFVIAPFKILEGKTVLPKYFKDYTNKTADDFISKLTQNNINYLDIRQAFLDPKVDTSKFFLKTEHHWSHTGAFFGYSVLLDYLKDSFSIDINKNGYYSDLSNYNIEQYKNSMYSYYADGLKMSFTGADTITLIYPKQETDIKLTYSYNTVREGNFRKAIFDQSYLNNLDTVIQKRYQCYLGNDTDMVVLENDNAETDQSILVIKDSFALPVGAWLSQNFKKVTLFDTRFMKTTATNFLKDNDFDIVIVLYNASLFKIAPAMFKF